MRAADVMETRVEVADICTDAEEAWQHMRRHDLQSLVVTEQGRIVGVIGRPRLATGARRHRHNRTLASFLPRSPVTVAADYPIGRAIALLDGDVSGCVPVIDRGRLLGVITISGLLRRLAHGEARARAS